MRGVTPRPHVTPWKDPVPIVQEAGWASGPVWTGAKISSPQEFYPRTVQPVGGRYTDYTTRPTLSILYIVELSVFRTKQATFKSLSI